MNLNAIMQKRSLRTRLVASFITLGVAALMMHSPVLAQQDRQLVQTGDASASSRRVALVIGNGAYTKAPSLKNPPNDARDMAATLKAVGFEVSSGVNLGQREMKRMIREFGQQLKTGGNGLFYYAGHGVQAKGRNYIIPIDAEIQSEADVEDSGVDVGLVLNYMDDAQNHLNIVILDACRNNPFARSFRSASEGLAQVDAPTGTLIAYATAPGRVAADGAGENGLYTSELLKAMRVPGLSATDMFMQVRREVMKRTGSKQVPWEASSLVGSFYFAPPNSTERLPASGTPTDTRVNQAAFELSYWESIKSSTDPEDFKAYLEKYPSGQFAALAKNKIRSLPASTKAAEPGTSDDQNSVPGPNPISGGILNGKALKLIDPPYPPSARATRASGQVQVQVVVDENGDVVSAHAISGHPLLQQAAVAAARESKFSPTRLSGRPVKVRGVVIFDFVLLK